MYTYQYSSCGILALLSFSAAVTISPLPYYDTKTDNQDAKAVRGTATFVDGYGSRDANTGGQGIYQHKNSGTTHHSPGNHFEPCRRIFGGMSNAGDYGTTNDDRYQHDGGSRYHGNEIDRDPYPHVQHRDYYPNFYPQEGMGNNRYPQDDCGQRRRPEYPPTRGGWDGGYDRRPPTYPRDSGRYPGDSGRYPGDNGRYPGDSGRYPADNGRYPGDSGRYPADNGRYPGDSGRYPADNGRYPADNGRYPGDSGRYPADNGRYPGDSGRYPADNGRYPGDSGRYPGDSSRYPGDSSRYPGERRWPASGDSFAGHKEGNGDRSPHWGRGSSWDHDGSPPGRGGHRGYSSRPPYFGAPSHGYQGSGMSATAGFWGAGKL